MTKTVVGNVSLQRRVAQGFSPGYATVFTTLGVIPAKAAIQDSIRGGFRIKYGMTCVTRHLGRHRDLPLHKILVRQGVTYIART